MTKQLRTEVGTLEESTEAKQGFQSPQDAEEKTNHIAIC